MNFYPNQPGSTYYGVNNVQPYNYQTPYYQQSPTLPQLQSNILGGKIVDGVDVIRSFDVPIGSTYFFPQADGKKIYAKGWNNNGTTFLNEFSLVDIQEETKPDPYEEKLNNIYDAISKLEKKIETSSIPAPTPKKKLVEVEVDE